MFEIQGSYTTTVYSVLTTGVTSPQVDKPRLRAACGCLGDPRRVLQEGMSGDQASEKSTHSLLLLPIVRSGLRLRLCSPVRPPPPLPF